MYRQVNRNLAIIKIKYLIKFYFYTDFMKPSHLASNAATFATGSAQEEKPLGSGMQY